MHINKVGRKRNAKGRKETCTKCGGLKERILQTWCNKCRNENSRKNRKKHRDLPEEQRKKANARSYLHVYIKRGKIIKPEKCEKCGEIKKLEAHHEDHAKPLEVIWLCRNCHIDYHYKTETT